MSSIPLAQRLREIDQKLRDGLINRREAAYLKRQAKAAEEKRDSEAGLMP